MAPVAGHYNTTNMRDRDTAEVGTGDPELTEGEAAEGGVDKQQEPRHTIGV